jgi:hypothetical protein
MQLHGSAALQHGSLINKRAADLEDELVARRKTSGK